MIVARGWGEEKAGVSFNEDKDSVLQGEKFLEIFSYCKTYIPSTTVLFSH